MTVKVRKQEELTPLESKNTVSPFIRAAQTAGLRPHASYEIHHVTALGLSDFNKSCNKRDTLKEVSVPLGL